MHIIYLHLYIEHIHRYMVDVADSANANPALADLRYICMYA